MGGCAEGWVRWWMKKKETLMMEREKAETNIRLV